jgi:predicted DNA-binding transcriptional regulator AlpA
VKTKSKIKYGVAPLPLAGQMPVALDPTSRELPKKKKRMARLAAADPNDPLAMIRKDELAFLLGVNPWTIDGWRKAGRIPQPITLSPQIVVWRRSDIDAWLRERQSASAQNPSPNPRARTQHREATDDA